MGCANYLQTVEGGKMFFIILTLGPCPESSEHRPTWKNTFFSFLYFQHWSDLASDLHFWLSLWFLCELFNNLYKEMNILLQNTNIVANSNPAAYFTLRSCNKKWLFHVCSFRCFSKGHVSSIYSWPVRCYACKENTDISAYRYLHLVRN